MAESDGRSGGASGATLNALGARLSRRGFLAAGCASAAMVGIGGLGVMSGQVDAPLLRPPGMDSQADLLARCNRCGRCLQACPYDIVTPLPPGESLVGWGTPTLDFAHGYCDFCMKCVDACPTGALRYGTATEGDIGVAVVVKDACVAWDWAGCTVCADECPVEGAIMLDEHDRPVIQENLCNGCGRCEQVCPTASLRAYDSTAAAKGIVVVSRQSSAARAGAPLTSAELREGRYRKGGDAA